MRLTCAVHRVCMRVRPSAQAMLIVSGEVHGERHDGTSSPIQRWRGDQKRLRTDVK